MRIPRRLALLAAGAAGFTYVRQVHRFRDPVRLPAPAPDSVLSPADGKVSFVRHIDQGHAEELNWPLSELLGQGVKPEGWLIGILVGPLDVHHTYFPADGHLSAVQHTPGQKQALGKNHLLPIMLQQPVDLLDVPGTRSNERFMYTLQSSLGPVQVVYVGSLWGLQATSYAQQDDAVRVGNKAAFLPEGGLVITYVPLKLRPAVSVGEQVTGAQTVLARQG